MSKIKFSRRGFLGTATATTGLALASPALAAGGLNRPDVIIGWTPWTDAEVITKLAAHVLRDHAGKDVELTLADIGAQFRTVASGDIDLMMMSWEPGLHRKYLQKHEGKLVDLGVLYQGTIGLAVPSWVPADLLNSIEDLNKPDVQDALGGKITGIDPGAGLMATTKVAMKDYGLSGYELTEGTGPKMQRTIAKAKKSEKAVVVTAWRPHMKFEIYGMRYLEDPKGIYADESQIHARASNAFVDREPEIADIIRRMNLEIPQIEAIMTQGRDIGVDEAISAWMAQNEDTIASWVN